MLWIELLRLFADLNLEGVVEKIKGKVSDSSSSVFDLIKLKNFLRDDNEESLQAAL